MHTTRRLILLVALTTTIACALPALASADTAKQATASMKLNGQQVSAAAWGRHLVNKFLTILETTNPRPALTTLLNPAFQIQRTGGVRQNKAEYLAKPAQLAGYELSQIRVTRHATTIVVTYWVTILGSVIEGMAYTAEPNPSQATFVYDAGAWTLLAYANFNKPS